MIGLLGAELRRFSSRRLFHTIALLLVAAFIGSAVVTAIESSKDNTRAVELARQEVARCRQSLADAGAPPGVRPADTCPDVEALADDFDDRFDYAATMPDGTRAVGMALFVLSFIVAASFVGAEWGSGSLVTLLTWEPRRDRIYAAKTIVASGAVAAGTVAALAFLDVLFLPVAALRGTTDGVDGALWLTLAGIWGRAAAIAVFGACLGSAIATVTRNTAGAIGVFFGYALIVENVLGAIRDGRLQPWLLVHLLSDVMGSRALLPADPISPAILLPIYGAGVLAGALFIFRRRDVT